MMLGMCLGCEILLDVAAQMSLKHSMRDCREFLLEGLTVLKNRGYDSAGLATMPINGGQMVCLHRL